jgi:hypothetical protein
MPGAEHGAGIQAGDIVPQSGIYTITHDPVHAEMPHAVTVIKVADFRPAGIARGSVFSSLMRQGMCRKSSISSSRMSRPCECRAVPMRCQHGQIES